MLLERLMFFSKKVKLQSQDHRVKYVGSEGNTLPLQIFTWNDWTLALTDHKFLAKLKFSKRKTISKVKVIRWKIVDSQLRALSHWIFMWNIKALALNVQKLLARLKFQRGGQNDRQDKNNMPPDLRSRGHKNGVNIFSDMCLREILIDWMFRILRHISNVSAI